MANIPNNPTLGDIKQFINNIVNSITTLTVDVTNETLQLNKNIIISTSVEDS